jgi:hypothetical protein
MIEAPKRLQDKYHARGLRPALRWMRASRSRPGRVAFLWACLALLLFIDALFFPDGPDALNSWLAISTIPVFAGMIASWALGLRSSTLGLIAIFLGTSIGAEAIWLGYKFPAALQSRRVDDLSFLPLEVLAIFALVLWLGYRQRSKTRRIAAIALVSGIHVFALSLVDYQELFLRTAAQAQALLYDDTVAEADEATGMPAIPVDQLWAAQAGLIASKVASLGTSQPGAQNVYALAIAADGRQQLFSNEAQLALKVAAARFEGNYRGGLLLSNGAKELIQHPLASNDNIEAAATAMAKRGDPSGDIALVYLASHGGRDAALSTSLPNYEKLSPISANTLAVTLDKAGIKRRVIVISACFSGSWIPALANDDTIVITAAAKNRTSFGCSDTSELTYFGEALLKGPLAKGSSLRDGFEFARKAVSAREATERLTPSNPQAYVGKNMQAFWTAKGSNRTPQ